MLFKPNLSMGLGFINLQRIKFICIMIFQKKMIKYNLKFLSYSFITIYYYYYVYNLNIFQ